MTRIERIHELPAELDVLVREAVAEDFRAVDRLREDWASGENRFAQVGEALFGARLGGRLVGLCGLNRDPFVDAEEDAPEQVGRVRRLYVLPDARRRGIGRALVDAVVGGARTHFAVLRLRTHDSLADAFYRAYGFVPVEGDPAATHILPLDDP